VFSSSGKFWRTLREKVRPSLLLARWQFFLGKPDEIGQDSCVRDHKIPTRVYYLSNGARNS